MPKRTLAARALIFSWPLAMGYLLAYQEGWSAVIPKGAGFGFGHWTCTWVVLAFQVGLLAVGGVLAFWLAPLPHTTAGQD